MGVEAFPGYAFPVAAGESRALNIGIDNLGEVPECNEDDNVFRGKLVRVCN